MYVVYMYVYIMYVEMKVRWKFIYLSEALSIIYIIYISNNNNFVSQDI